MSPYDQYCVIEKGFDNTVMPSFSYIYYRFDSVCVEKNITNQIDKEFITICCQTDNCNNSTLIDNSEISTIKQECKFLFFNRHMNIFLLKINKNSITRVNSDFFR